MERKHTHVSWETTVTAVMVTVLLISLATAEVGETLALPRENKAERAADRARARSSLPPGKNDSSSEDDYDAHHRGVRQVLKDFQAVEETYCQGFNHNHIGEMADHIQQMATTDYRPSNDADQRVAETTLQFAIVQRARALTRAMRRRALCVQQC